MRDSTRDLVVYWSWAYGSRLGGDLEPGYLSVEGFQGGPGRDMGSDSYTFLMDVDYSFPFLTTPVLPTLNGTSSMVKLLS